MDQDVVGFNESDAAALIKIRDHRDGSVSTTQQPPETLECVLAYTAGGATARSGSVLGSGTAVVQKITTATRSDWTRPATGTLTLDFLNVSTSAVSAGYIMLKRERVSGKWICIWEDCGP